MRATWAVLTALGVLCAGGAGEWSRSIGRADEQTTAAATRLSWRETGASLALLNGEQIVWQFNHLRDGSERGCPYFHPLATLDGSALTDLRPEDHLWHRGLRFAWKEINGLDGYWTWPEGLATFPDATGETEVTAVQIAKGDDFSARFELELIYHPPGQGPDLTEKRVIRVSAPDLRGSYHIDWQGAFTAGQRGAVLDRTPIPGQPDGKPWGGYAGLQLRLTHRKNLAAWELLNSEGLTASSGETSPEQGLQKIHGKQARWMQVAITLADGKTAGVTLFDHPNNLRYPAVWHTTSMPNELIQTPLFFSPYTLAAGESLTLHYCILVCGQPADASILEAQWKDFAQGVDH